MPVYSMTGYAHVQDHDAILSTSSIPAGADSTLQTGAGSGVRLGMEIRSVNSRFLDISFRLPDELRQHEPALRELLTASCKRGKLELRASLDLRGNSTLPEPSPKLLQNMAMVQNRVQSWLPQATPLSVADALRLVGNETIVPTDLGADLLALAQTGIQQLLDSRAREGKRLYAMLLDRLGSLRQLAQTAGPLVPKLVEQQRQRFLDRWKEAMSMSGGQTLPEAAQDRALTEATAFAIRIDVSEELTRLASHIDEIERLLGKGGEVGKRLDFLIQELHREANTLGSKSALLEMTRISVDMKVLIEQMREQVQNIE
ncbi:MAG: YicC family protein [Betaproteobacteria bacterium]|nr:YicC family protein [Betaproteobacteria bacterium]